MTPEQINYENIQIAIMVPAMAFLIYVIGWRMDAETFKITSNKPKSNTPPPSSDERKR